MSEQSNPETRPDIKNEAQTLEELAADTIQKMKRIRIGQLAIAATCAVPGVINLAAENAQQDIIPTWVSMGMALSALGTAVVTSSLIGRVNRAVANS